MEDAQRRDAGVRERKMVRAGFLAELGDDLVVVEPARPLSSGPRPFEQRLARAEAIQLLAVPDAVEVDHADRPRQLASLADPGHVPARADEADLLGAEGDEPDRPRMRARA